MGLGAAFLREAKGAFDEKPEDRLKTVMARVMQEIGLGGGKEHPLDPRREERGKKRVSSHPERREHVIECRLEIGDRARSSVQGRQQIDEHDLPIEPREMLPEKGQRHMGLVGFEARFHQRRERIARHGRFAKIERCESERGRSFEIAWHEETTWRQK